MLMIQAWEEKIKIKIKKKKANKKRRAVLEGVSEWLRGANASRGWLVVCSSSEHAELQILL